MSHETEGISAIDLTMLLFLQFYKKYYCVYMCVYQVNGITNCTKMILPSNLNKFVEKGFHKGGNYALRCKRSLCKMIRSQNHSPASSPHKIKKICNTDFERFPFLRGNKWITQNFVTRNQGKKNDFSSSVSYDLSWKCFVLIMKLTSAAFVYIILCYFNGF